MRRGDLTVIYVLWRGELRRFGRSKARIAATLALPLLFLVGFWLGFRTIQLPGGLDLTYLDFLVPGIVGVTMLFAAAVGGISVIVDRRFGVLKAVLVTPVDRVAIVLGRIAGSTTTAVVQGLLVLVIAIAMGFRPTSWLGLGPAVVFMALIGTTYLGLSLVIGACVSDVQAFNLVFNFVLFPLLFLSGAIYPLAQLPPPVVLLAYLNPLTYGIDGLRAVLVGSSLFPAWVDLAVLVGYTVVFGLLGARAFDGMEGV